MKSTVGKVSAIMVLLAFIIASVLVLNIALAQNETNVFENVTINDTVDNETTSWDFVEEISLNETVENVTLTQNETTNETSFSNTTNETVVNETNITSNETFVNETNVTLNETIDQNITLNETNVTVNETETFDETEENETSIEPPVEPTADPNFDVKLLYPQKIIRGESIDVTATVTSDTFAKNVYLKWILPQGMYVVSGNEIETCGDLDASSCVSNITVSTSGSVLGLSEIKVVVSYEK